MRPPHPARSPRRRRPGVVLALFVLLLPALLGLTGLVIDGGLLMATHRQAQNAADAAALAAAMELFRGNTNTASILAAANTFMADNGLAVALALNAGASNALNLPPQDPFNSGSPYRGNAHFAEAIVTAPVTTAFIQVLGGGRSRQVTARAVAGYEPVASGEGAIVLDPRTPPTAGLSISGQNTMLMVNGTVVVNASGAGMDQYGNDVNGSEAITTVRTPSIVAQEVQSVGGIDILDNLRRYDPAYAPTYYNLSDPDRPFTRLPSPVTDPLWNLPVPTSSNGVQVQYPQYNSATNTWTLPATGPASDLKNLPNNQQVNVPPGIYKSISIGNGNVVNFQPGIYVIGVGATGGGSSLSITGGTVTGSGVMFYNTGSNYKPDGSNDAGAGENADPSGVSLPPNKVIGADGSTANFSSIQVNGGTVNLSPYGNAGNANDPFNGMLFYQRRWNQATASVGGSSNNVNLTGTIYAKWAKFQLAGQGKYNAQYIVGSLAISGNATVTINATGKNRGRANQVFLVE